MLGDCLNCEFWQVRVEFVAEGLHFGVHDPVDEAEERFPGADFTLMKHVDVGL
ncbi:MAG: hypothetical protein ABSB67_16030 [Bryobacteraceae bacterium]|jgi:hypothetical protein